MEKVFPDEYLLIYSEEVNNTCIHLGFLIRDSLQDSFELIHYWNNKIQKGKVSGKAYKISISKEKQQEAVSIIKRILEKNKNKVIPISFTKEYSIFSFDGIKQSEGLNCSTFILNVLFLINLNLNINYSNIKEDLDYIKQICLKVSENSYRHPAHIILKLIKEYNEFI